MSGYAPNEARWRRLTISDLLVITCAMALGFSLAVAEHRQYQRSRSLRESSQPTEPGARCFVFGAVIGLQLTAPLILATQFLFYRRRRRPSLQEWLWLTPLAAWIAVYTCNNLIPFDPWRLHSFAVFIVAGVMVPGIWGALQLLDRSTKIGTNPDTTANWYWGDYAGCLSCMGAACYAFLDLTIHPIVI